MKKPTKKCKVPGCNHEAKYYGLCEFHYLNLQE